MIREINSGISKGLIAALIFSFILIVLISIFLFTHHRKVTQTLDSGEQHFNAITGAAAQVSSYAKRAEGHMMLYLNFHRDIDRKKVPRRLDALNKQIMILDQLVQDPDARTVVEKIKTLYVNAPAIVQTVFTSHDTEYKKTGRFDMMLHQQTVLKAHDIFSGLRKSGVELTELELSLENKVKTQVLDNSAALRTSLYMIMGSVIVFILFIGILMVQSNLTLKREITKRKKAQRRLELSYESQAAVNTLLADSLGNKNMMDILRKCLELVISMPWCSFDAKASIFLIEDAPDILVLKAQHGFSREQTQKCAIIPFGSCLCGQAAAGKEIIFRDHVDEDHVYRFDGTHDHGHYCVPIASQDRVFGVLNIYVPPGHPRASFEEDFLTAIANTLAGLLMQRYARADKKKIQAQLHQSLKMESIGQLAAGIAHEINTPIQYLNDNTAFLKDAFQDMAKAVQTMEQLCTSGKNLEKPELIKKARAILEYADIDYLKKEVPQTIEQSIEGLNHISSIVASMKAFSHPGDAKMEKTDINQALENTILVTKNYWKGLAAMIREFDPSLPHVMCNPGELNQVFLNIMTNACHSIQQANQNQPDKKGQIRIRTAGKDKWLRISISDSGTGIPEEIQPKVFDPFFTTKDVGKGTGQGLAVSHTIIVEKHKGRLFFETRKNKGTAFIIELPVNA